VQPQRELPESPLVVLAIVCAKAEAAFQSFKHYGSTAGEPGIGTESVHPSASVFPDRHARPEHGIWKQRDLRPKLPATGFGQQRINAVVRVRRVAGPRALRLHRSQITPRSTLDVVRFTWIAPRSASFALCWSPI